jgi:hypothetical protein
MCLAVGASFKVTRDEVAAELSSSLQILRARMLKIQK